MFRHVFADASLELFDDTADEWTEAVVKLPANFAMLEEPLGRVVTEVISAEDLGHRPVGAAVIFEQLFEPIFGLSVANNESGLRQVGGKDVGNAKRIAVKGRFS